MRKLKQQMELAAALLFTTIFLVGANFACTNAAHKAVEPETDIAQTGQAEAVAVELSVKAAPLMLASINPTLEEPAAEEREVLYDVPLSDELQRYIREKCDENGVPFDIAVALIGRESSYRSWAVSSTDDYGLMQINACNHEWLEEELGIADMMDPYQNIDAGTYILGKAFKNYGNPHQALMAYNMGDDGVSRAWNEGHRSSAYSRAVMEAARGLRKRGETG